MPTQENLIKLSKDGKWVVQVELPTIGQGGTMLLQTQAGDIVNASVQGATEEPIEAGYFRVHFKTLPSDNLSSLGLWTWDDVENHRQMLVLGQQVQPISARLNRMTMAIIWTSR